MRSRLLGAAALVAFAVLGVASPALADSITIREIDATRLPRVTVQAQVSGPTPNLAEFALRENGKIVQGFDVVPISKTSTKIGIVLVVDVSGSMVQNDKIGAARLAAKEFVQRKLPEDQIALVAFSDRATMVQDFTSDAGTLSSAIDSLVARGNTALWDGVELARTMLEGRPDLQRNMVVLSDGVDEGSITTVDEARINAVASKVTVFALGLKGTRFDSTGLQQLADSTGGYYDETVDPKALGERYASIQRDLQNQYEITYTSTATGTVTVSVAAAGLRTEASFDGAVVTAPPPPAARPEVLPNSPMSGVVGSFFGRVAIALTGLAAVGLLVAGILGVAVRDRQSLPEVLRPYDTDRRRAADRSGEVALAETAIVQRAVEATSRLLTERGLLEKLSQKLAQADLPLRPAEAAFFYGASVVVLTVIGLLLGGPFGGAMAFIFSVLIPLATLELLAGRRRRAFTEQLPDMLQALASSLRAGYSLLQGLEAVVEQMHDPMHKEMRRALIEARLGRPVEEALGDVARRLGSVDLEWAVMAIAIQREVGGNLAELLQTVAETMIARVRLQREIRALTAEGRISAVVLGILPVALGVIMYGSNPDYIGVLFEKTAGQVMLVGAILLALFGFWWMKKTIEIEV